MSDSKTTNWQRGLTVLFCLLILIMQMQNSQEGRLRSIPQSESPFDDNYLLSYDNSISGLVLNERQMSYLFRFVKNDSFEKATNDLNLQVTCKKDFIARARQYLLFSYDFTGRQSEFEGADKCERSDDVEMSNEDNARMNQFFNSTPPHKLYYYAQIDEDRFLKKIPWVKTFNPVVEYNVFYTLWACLFISFCLYWIRNWLLLIIKKFQKITKYTYYTLLGVLKGFKKNVLDKLYKIGKGNDK